MTPVRLVTTLVADVMNNQQLDRLDELCDARLAGGRTSSVGTQPPCTTGDVRRLLGTLHTDRYTVAEAINRLLNNGTSPRSLALQLPDGHVLDSDDIVATDRAVICFRALA